MYSNRQVICTQCGAELIPDEECKIYRCNFCGVAFGSSILFDEETLPKAKKSLQLGEFDEADVWYNCALMTEPQIFEALVGRILCASKWKRLGEIQKDQPFTPVRLENVNKRITEAMDHSKDQDKEYFAKFKRLFEILDRLWDKDEKSKPDSREISELNSEYEILRKELVLEGNKGIADS